MKLKKLATALTLALIASTSAFAAADRNIATTSTAANDDFGSTVVFSAWSTTSELSYSFDLGYTLDSFIGADTNSGMTGSSTNSMPASGSTFTDFTPLHIALPDFNLVTGGGFTSGAVWNLAAADSLGRNRFLVSNFNPNFSAPINSQVNIVASNVSNYLGLGAAYSQVAGSTSSSANDDWYANSVSWGDRLGGTTIANTANSLGSTSDLYVVWAKSLELPSNTAGFSLVDAGADTKLQAYTTIESGVAYLNIASVAAVPEAETSGMMLAGLGLMGFIARRRSYKQA